MDIHIHIGDSDLLTDQSLEAVMAHIMTIEMLLDILGLDYITITDDKETVDVNENTD